MFLQQKGFQLFFLIRFVLWSGIIGAARQASFRELHMTGDGHCWDLYHALGHGWHAKSLESSCLDGGCVEPGGSWAFCSNSKESTPKALHATLPSLMRRPTSPSRTRWRWTLQTSNVAQQKTWTLLLAMSHHDFLELGQSVLADKNLFEEGLEFPTRNRSDSWAFFRKAMSWGYVDDAHALVSQQVSQHLDERHQRCKARSSERLDIGLEQTTSNIQ